MNSLCKVDDLVKEYLLFRGFNKSFRTLELETRQDKDKAFQVEKMIDELQGYITQSDIHNLLDYYQYLDQRFFSRLEQRFQRTVKKFELCLLRHYLVHAIQHKRRDKVTEFFEVYGAELHGKSEWTPWFALPYLKDPASDPLFEPYFTKTWADTYITSLYNFLSTIFHCMPVPNLLTLHADRMQIKSQQSEIEQLKSSVELLKTDLDAKKGEIEKLKQEVSETRNELSQRVSEISLNELGDALLEPIDTSVNDLSEWKLQEFSEHASAIVHARFSTKGDCIASCDMDNIVRIWSDQEEWDLSPRKSCSSSTILSLEWEPSGHSVLLGTDRGQIQVYNVEKNAVVHRLAMEDDFPWITQLSCNPIDPSVVCAGAGNKMLDTKQPLAVCLWDLKKMTLSSSYRVPADEPCRDILTMNHNHNGKLLVTGDDAGCVRIYDARTSKPISEWTLQHGQSPCMAQFSFDESKIYTLDHRGELVHWSVHQPGQSLLAVSLSGIPPPPAYSAPRRSATMMTSVSASPSAQTSFPIEPPRPTSNLSSSSSRRSVSSVRSARIQDDSIAQTLLSVSPRSQAVAFDPETERILSATVSPTQASPSQTSSATQGTLFNLAGRVLLQFRPHSYAQRITTVHWTHDTQACLFGGADGSVKVYRV